MRFCGPTALVSSSTRNAESAPAGLGRRRRPYGQLNDFVCGFNAVIHGYPDYRVAFLNHHSQPFRQLQRSRMTASFAYPLGARIGRPRVACSARALPAPSLGQVLLLRAV